MTPVLEQLEDARVFSVQLSDDNTTLTIEERCDEYFSLQLTLHDVISLCAELLSLAEQMDAARTKLN